MRFVFRLILTCTACSTIVMGTGCVTTTESFKPSQSAMSGRGIAVGDTVLVRYVNGDNVKSSSISEQIRITEVHESGIVGVSEDNAVVNANYDEIYRIDYRKTTAKRTDPLSNVDRRTVGEALMTFLNILTAGAH